MVYDAGCVLNGAGPSHARYDGGVGVEGSEGIFISDTVLDDDNGCIIGDDGG